MEDALLKDHESNKNKKPAFLRFALLSKIENTLMKTNHWQEEFLHKDGCQRLSDWLKQMPDGTYPNSKIVLCIMGCIDRLPIDQALCAESDLEQALEMYKHGVGAGYQQCQALAKNILNKWYRNRFNIQTTYDAEGNYDNGYRGLQR